MLGNVYDRFRNRLHEYRVPDELHDRLSFWSAYNPWFNLDFDTPVVYNAWDEQVHPGRRSATRTRAVVSHIERFVQDYRPDDYYIILAPTYSEIRSLSPSVPATEKYLHITPDGTFFHASRIPLSPDYILAQWRIHRRILMSQSAGEAE